MDTRDRDDDDQAEAPVRGGGGEDAVVSGDSRGCEGVSGEQDATSLALSGERGRRRGEEAPAAAVAVGEEADASPAVAGEYDGVLTDGVVERRSQEEASASVALTGERGRRGEAAAEEEEEASAPPAVAGDDDGYVTPTSPSHRLQAPKVCPPAPRAQSARRLGRALVMREMAASASPPGRKRIQANRDPDEVVDAFMRSLQRRLFPPEDEKKKTM